MTKNLFYMAAVILIGGSIAAWSDLVAVSDSLGIRFLAGAGFALLVFGYGGLLGRLPFALRLLKTMNAAIAYKEELINFVVFGVAIICGTLMVGVALVYR